MIETFKSEITGSFGELKFGVKKDKWFLLVLFSLSVLFVMSAFFEFVIIFAIIIMLASVVFFNYEKCLCLFLFTFPFYALFHFGYVIIYEYVYYIMFFICVIKYVIKLFKSKKQLNTKILLPLLCFLIYISLPIYKVNANDAVKFLTFVSVFYLTIDSKNEINVKPLVAYASIAILLSSIVSLFIVDYSLLYDIVGTYIDGNLVKFQGFFTNPNIFSAFSILIIPLIINQCIKKNSIFWYLLFIPILYLSYRTLSKVYLIGLAGVLLFVFVSICIKKDKNLFFRFIPIILICLITVLCLLKYTNAYLGRFDNISKEFDKPPVVEDIENAGSYWWKGDGTPADPGRWNLWIRYLNDFISLPENILFGAGISAEMLGQYSHNFFIEYLWRLGILGVIIGLIAFLIVIIKLFKNFKENGTNALIVSMFVLCCFETMFFSVSFSAMIILFMATSKGEIDNKKFIKK